MESTDENQSREELLRGAEKEPSLNRQRQKPAQKDDRNFELTAPKETSLDIISCLSHSASLENVQNLVWNKLDWKSLKNATLVKRSWNSSLDQDLFWQDLLY